MIRFLIHFFSLTNHFISFLLVSLVVLALFIFSLQDKISFPPKPRNASFWDTPDFRRVIVVISLRLIDTFSLLMSSFSYPFPLSSREKGWKKLLNLRPSTFWSIIFQWSFILTTYFIKNQFEKHCIYSVIQKSRLFYFIRNFLML